jgi:hypothetical protein
MDPGSRLAAFGCPAAAGMTTERACPLAGDLIYGHFDGYAWLDIGS